MEPLLLEQKKSSSCLSCSFILFLLAAGGILVATNPGMGKYQKYGTEALVRYAKENVCIPTSKSLEELVKSQLCNVLLEAGRKEAIPAIIATNTKRDNYLLLSIYRTDLYLYSFETVGILNNFYVYRAKKTPPQAQE
ncbi:MAG: DUF4359 domain-containing protein [Geminocystis sp.]|nr:DUF4359 domain-containing protein [Geminocystis sp.]HIK38196.1 DUF4359 domain-containing protein [Geminocystis sp. M7585_C2015_104]MCS7148666.1 DUF4359 domain-containing protein [Geminocystis sp.]MCX8078196.1 DUF4359 domain-containing protein [Geminocystis sp.]MDW8115080.1 DUF4359 domain-containing protein [Geminocystis sp.]